MAETNGTEQRAGKFGSIAQMHWVAGLVVAVVLSHLLVLVVIGLNEEKPDHQWPLLILVGIIVTIIAVAVGFAVRLTSSASVNQTFLAAFVTGGLGVHVVVGAAGKGFDEFAGTMLGAYLSSPLTGYVIFYGIVAALVATVGRRA